EVVAVPGDERHVASAHVGQGAIAVPFHLEDPAGSGRHRFLERREHRPVPTTRRLVSRRGSVLALPQDQPVLLLAVEPRGDERPAAGGALPVQATGRPAVPLLLEELVAATVPDLDRPGAVLALRDLPFETCVLQRMVLDVDGEMLLARLERHTLG